MEKIVATHIVKPSSPTSVEFKTHKLSFLDQIMPPIYIPLIFFYQNGESLQPTKISERLKQSLSHVLTIFYPFAGTVRENSFIDCDDSGAEMVEARIHAPLQQFTQDPDVEELEPLLPMARSQHRDNQLVLVKVNYFDCGGVAVGVLFLHKIGDAASLVMFMNAWAATCRGETSQIIYPSFDLALHFPPTKITTVDPFERTTIEKNMMKRVVFEREKLEKVKKEAAKKVKDPTTVEALSGFIWKAAIEAYKAKSVERERETFIGSQAVNLRPRTNPPIPNHTMGNCVTTSSVLISWEEDEDERERESGVHVSKFKAAIKGVDNDYINNVIKDGEKYTRKLVEAGDFFRGGNCIVTSWCRFPIYEVDFGWGKPYWVATASSPGTNHITLMSTPSGDGVEVWINISEDNLNFVRLLQANCNNLLRTSLIE